MAGGPVQMRTNAIAWNPMEAFNFTAVRGVLSAVRWR